MENLNQYIDHTLLKPESSTFDIEKLCEEALKHSFHTVCLHPYHIKKAAHLLEGSDIGVCTVVGFPLGASLSGAKAFETKLCVDCGAQEIDMVINISALKEGLNKLVLRDISAVVEAAGGRVVKVILETCLLTPDEIVRGCQAAMEAGAHFVKTSTGFSTSGATVEAIKIMKETVGDKLKVKASGGIRDRETALEMIAAGADRLGTSSSLKIIGVGESSSSY